jgi:hypothetical protein
MNGIGARWFHPYSGTFIQRLQPQRHPHGRADEAARHSMFTHGSIGLGETAPHAVHRANAACV